MRHIMIRCFTCDSEFQFGADNYEGIRIPEYDIVVCWSCYEANAEGWQPDIGERILRHLADSGVPAPKCNDQGWILRGTGAHAKTDPKLEPICCEPSSS